MLLVFKILLVAIGVIGQGHLMPDQESPVASDLDTLAFPADHPEWVLARRAMASEGLCHPGHPLPGDTASAERRADPGVPTIEDYTIVRLVNEACD